MSYYKKRSAIANLRSGEAKRCNTRHSNRRLRVLASKAIRRRESQVIEEQIGDMHCDHRYSLATSIRFCADCGKNLKP